MPVETDNYRSIIRLDHELNQIQDLDLLLERILLEARRVVHADAGSIYVKEWVKEEDRRVEKLVIKYAHNDTLQQKLPPGQKLVYSVFALDINEKTISGYCGATKKLVNVADVYHIPEDAPYSFSTSYDRIAGYKTVSTLAIPLMTADSRLMGIIQMINAKDEKGNIIPFSRDDEFVISHFAVNATVVLQRAYMTRAMILRMIKMSELRDPKETGPHVNRVAGYAVEIYDKWAVHQHIAETERERFRDTLRIAAMLHDVGKVAISDIILKKPARFTSDEYLIMQHHTIYGAALFDDIQSDLDIISRDIALTHHENWDGTGYPGWIDPVTEEPIKTDAGGNPLGRKGEEIPLTGRIVAIADVYDALCSKRIYKEAWTEEQVLEEIRQLAGKKFDPLLVECFFQSLHNIKQIQALYPEQNEHPE
ncbi:MAG: HD domain-containing protein [Spirochaetaceae bacterium]|jgi:HD-GYP domain-containing protein (c-di-GMP phosphodiesterase class II)|nr:HD domain-containing protein [Spirochaetaceae bacterium]